MLENPQDHQDLEQQAAPRMEEKILIKINAFQKYLTAMYMYFTLKRVHSSTQMLLLLKATSNSNCIHHYHKAFISELVTAIVSLQCECFYNAPWRGPGHKFCSTE